MRELVYALTASKFRDEGVFSKNARIPSATGARSELQCARVRPAREKGHVERLGGRQIRNEFFCFEHPAKRATREKTIPDCYPTVVSRGEPRRAAERRGKRAKRAVRVCETFSAAMYAASARVANPAHLYERTFVRVKPAAVCAPASTRAHAGI